MTAGYRLRYVQSSCDLAHHWKVEALADAVGIGVPAALGHLHLLWWFTANASPEAQLTGDLSKFGPAVIERRCQWNGAAGALVDGLVSTGWLERVDDGSLCVHDWAAHTGQGVERMNAAATRMRAYRAAKQATVLPVAPASSPPVTPASSPPVSPVVATVRARSGTVRARSAHVVRDPDPDPDPDPESFISPPSGEAASPAAPARHASSLHPAVGVVRETLGVSPVGPVRDAIVEALPSPTDADLERLREACGAWRLRGHNPRNVAGVLDWYRDGVPSLVRPTVRASSTTTRESPASRMRALGETLKELEVANGANGSGAFGRGRDVGLLAGGVPTAGRGGGGSGSARPRLLGSGSGA